jgi:DNA polymerase delta subunit 1
MHYLYVAAPISFQKEDCEGFKSFLEVKLGQNQPAIYTVQMVMRENLFGFQGNQKSPYIKITVTDPKYINKLRTVIEANEANYKGLWRGVDSGILTFDQLAYVLRFMVDTKVGQSCVTLVKPRN